MKRTLSIVSLAVAAAAFSCNALAQKLDASKLTDADITSIVERMASSGALDKAMDASVKRFAQAQQAQAAQQRDNEAKRSSDMAKNARKVDASRDHIFGNPAAQYSYIVYTDLECPYCKEHSGKPEEASKTFDDKVNVVMRQLPLPMHGEVARKEAIAAECVAKQAGSNGFFSFINKVFAATALNGKGVPDGDAGLLVFAKESGMKDEGAYKVCLNDPKIAQLVQDDLKDGELAGVRGTPGNIIRDNKTGVSIAAHGYSQGGAKAIAQSIKSAFDLK